MSILDDRDEYKKNPFFEGHEYSDYTPFYVAISICSIFGVFLIILNIAFCWCSRHKDYWRDRHTGNRLIVSLWTATPQNNPPLDLTEIEGKINPTKEPDYSQYQRAEFEHRAHHSQEYMELREKRESEI